MTKVIIGFVVLALIGAGAYWYFFMNNTTPTPQENNTEQTPSDASASDQVEGQDVTIGEGREATPGTRITVEYVGQLEDGTVFDSSETHGQPLVFVLGAPGIIPGFQIGVNGMKEGGERIIVIPPSLGYGDQQVANIPPNSRLIFTLKLTSVEDVAASDEGSAPETPEGE